jgi:hypothetical protein
MKLMPGCRATHFLNFVYLTWPRTGACIAEIVNECFRTRSTYAM